MSKTKTVTGYTLKELKEVSQVGYAKALETLKDEVHSDPDDFTLDECMKSLKALMSALNLKLTDWEIGPYAPSWLRYEDEEPENEYGEPCRTIKERLSGFLIERGYTKNGKTSFPGLCALTGVCFDDDLLEHLHKTTDVGSLAEKIADIAEDDLEYRASEEGLLESPMAHDRYFTAEGKDVTDLLD